jgi:hypothetical protein
MDTDYYPLAHLSNAAESEINETVNSQASNAFKIRDRDKR